jgi:hypothetical protein
MRCRALVTLCSDEGRSPSGLRFHHADGTTYGGAVSADEADLQLRAFRALRALGFGEREARLALRQSPTHAGENAELEPLLRHAIGLLTASALAKAS